MIKDCARHMGKSFSIRAEKYLNFIYDCANKYLMPISDENLDLAVKETDEFIEN